MSTILNLNARFEKRFLHRPRKVQAGEWHVNQGTVFREAELAGLPNHYYHDLGQLVRAVYGPRDAFNTDQDWESPIFMGLIKRPSPS
jgi:hypothetical protein